MARAAPGGTTAAIGLGSNLGDRARHIAQALVELGAHGTVTAISGLYETAPIGGPRQGPFLNAVVLLNTSVSPRDLLEECLTIEKNHDRERFERWGPRTLDLDILLFGGRRVKEQGLEIPHPELTKRRFVLEPLLEVWPQAMLPDGTPVAGFMAHVQDQQVRRLESSPQNRGRSFAIFAVTGVAAAFLWWLAGLLL